jgi:hypothetical protein
MLDSISFNPARQQADLIGSLVAGWADVGLHPETMWLGYTTGSAAAWHPKGSDAREAMNSFYRLFYGDAGTNVGRLYQLMSEQAQFWKESWGVQASAARTPYWGDWNIIYKSPRPASDQTLPLLPVPQPPLLTLGSDWEQQNARRIEMAGKFLDRNDELLNLIYLNLRQVHLQTYNLEVYLSIAQLFRQNLQMLSEMQRISDSLKTAAMHAGRAESAEALESLDRALDLAVNIREQRNQALQDASDTWYQRWFPRVSEANGRRFLDRVDDVKDHLPVRTVDLNYLVYRELLYPLNDWAEQTVAARNEYAKAHRLPARSFHLEWQRTSPGVIN